MHLRNVLSKRRKKLDVFRNSILKVGGDGVGIEREIWLKNIDELMANRKVSLG